MNRRKFCTIVLAGVATSGCSSLVPPSGTDRTNGRYRECEVPDSSPVPRIDFPAQVTEATAQSFALEVEESYARKRAEVDGWVVDGIDLADVSEYSRSSNNNVDYKFMLQATIELDMHKENESSTETTLGSETFEGWYKITEKFAERAPGENTKTPPGKNWVTVACS